MKILAIHGSPRREGNSHILVKEAIRAVKEEGHEVNFFRPSEMNFSPCISCGGCNGTGICSVNDDMKEIYRSIRKSDRFIVASPVYFFNLPAQLKAVIDRCQSIWNEKFILKKTIPAGPRGRKGLFILVSALKKNNPIKCSKSVMTAFFNTINVPKYDTLVYTGVDGKGEIKNYPKALEEVYRAGKKLII